NGGTLRLAGALDNTGQIFVNGSTNTWQIGATTTSGAVITGGTLKTLPGSDLVIPVIGSNINIVRAVLNSVTLDNATIRMALGSFNDSAQQLLIPHGISGNGTIVDGEIDADANG